MGKDRQALRRGVVSVPLSPGGVPSPTGPALRFDLAIRSVDRWTFDGWT